MSCWKSTFILVWIECHKSAISDINVTCSKKNVVILLTTRQIRLIELFKKFDETIRLRTFLNMSCTFLVCVIVSDYLFFENIEIKCSFICIKSLLCDHFQSSSVFFTNVQRVEKYRSSTIDMLQMKKLLFKIFSI